MAERFEIRSHLSTSPEVDLGRLVPKRTAGSLEQEVRPAQPDRGEGKAQSGLLLGQKVRPAFAEAFRLLALNVQEMAVQHDVKSILVMSAYHGDGRTVVVGNLAVALAGTGARVAVVDSDVRKPGVGRLFGLDQGFERLEDADAPPVGSAVLTGVPGVVMVRVPSPRSANPDPGVVAWDLKALVETLRDRKDFVLLDSPPCLGYSDAFYFARLVDGVIYVVRRRRQNVEAQRNVQKQLARLRTRLLGVVFNEE